MEAKLDRKDLKILRSLQRNCKISTKILARELQMPVTTIYSKIKRMEGLGIVKGYKAILDSKKLGKPVTCFVLISFEYRLPETKQILSQREVAEQISKFPEVQDVHILAGEWDMILKVKAESVEDLGRFVLDKLRKMEGIEKTLSLISYDTKKETSDIYI
jgi:DNA-binding Lrp family transcriptional regulator